MTYPQMDPRRLDLTGTFGLRVANRDAAEVRIGTAGRWEQRVNLATNPSFEATSGTVVVRTNLATSPKSYTPATSGPHPGLGAGPYTGSAEIDGARQEIDPLALVGGTTYVRLLIESGTVPLGDYFDGDESPDPDLTPEWTGAVNASTSRLRGSPVTGAGGGYGSHTTAKVSSGQWSIAGAKSMRLIPTGTGNDTFAQFDVGLAPGRAYRASVTAWLPEPLAGTINSRWGYVSAGIAGAQGAQSIFARVPNVAGTHRVAGVLSADFLGWMRLYNGASQGNGDIWYDALLVEDVTDLAAQWATLPDPKPTLSAWLDERLGTDHFDGDTPDTPAALHHWTATPHASTSVRTLAWQPGD